MRTLCTVLFLLATVPGGDGDDRGWELLADDGDVKIWRRPSPSGLVEFRGEGRVEAPLGKLVTISMTPSRYPEWTDMLAEVIELERRGPFDLVVWEHYDQPWPVSDRDFVYHTLGTPEPEAHRFTVRYSSVQRADRPEQPCCVRGVIDRSWLRFTALPDGTCKVEIQALIDPKGWLPHWVVNLVQKDWPQLTLDAFRLQAKKTDVEITAGFEAYHRRGD